MNRIVELFGQDTQASNVDWAAIVSQQICPFSQRKCFKIRKSQPEISIGTCSALHGQNHAPVVICPNRFLDNGQIFVDCLHLLTNHEPGNVLHVIPELSIPGGNVDFVLASVRNGSVKDFVAIEVQALDTTGTLWPLRQNLLLGFGILKEPEASSNTKAYGMNWKMTAKTTLVQLHHKLQTFEHINKKLVLVFQNCLMDYMKRNFQFQLVNQQASTGDSLHFHAYGLNRTDRMGYTLQLEKRTSTDVEGLKTSLGLQAEQHVELQSILKSLDNKITEQTRFTPALMR